MADKPEYQPNYPDGRGKPATWCNYFGHDAMKETGVNSKYITDNSGWPLLANKMEESLSEASKNPEETGVRKVSAEEAQNAANNGEPVLAAWNNPGGHGHAAVVVADNEKYDPDEGPRTAQAGNKNWTSKDDKHAIDAFKSGWKSYTGKDTRKNPVEFYVLDK